jgi:hypothetical protein
LESSQDIKIPINLAGAIEEMMPARFWISALLLNTAVNQKRGETTIVIESKRR